MNLQEILHELDIDYARLIARFSQNEALLKKFLLRFPSDPTFAALRDSVHSRSLPAVEQHAHTLKGVSANLGFDTLSGYCAKLVQAVREGRDGEVPALFALVEDSYSTVLACIDKIIESGGEGS